MFEPLSVIIGFLLGIFISILVLEYRSRKKTLRVRRYWAKLGLTDTLGGYINGWQDFKSIWGELFYPWESSEEEASFRRGLKQFQMKLVRKENKINRKLPEISRIYSEDVVKEVQKIGEEIKNLAEWNFNTIDTNSWKEFLKRGNDLSKRSEELMEKIA